MRTRRNELARVLSEIDGLLADAEDIVENPEDDDREGALNRLVEFQEYKRAVEGELGSL